MYIPIKLEAQNFQSFETLSYDFKVGKAILIEGENKTDEGQKTNGSGKTGFTEMIYYLLLGTSSTGKRDVKLVQWGCKQATLSLTLHNEYLKHTLKIERELFSGSKSSTLEIYINGESQRNRYSSVPEGNKLILELLDISADDLKNYFLVNRRRFVSFFDSPDSAKRSLLARFSNIDRVLNAIAEIDVALKDRQELHLELSKKEIACQSRIDLLNKQIEETDFETEHSNQLQSLQDMLDSNEKRIVGIDKQIADIEKSILDNQSKVDEKQKEVDNFNEKIKNLQSINYDEKLSVNSNKQAKLREETDSIWNEKKKFDSEGESLNSSLQPILLMLQKVVTCPNCQTEFAVGDETIDLEQARLLAEETQKEIDNLKQIAQDLEAEYNAQKQSKTMLNLQFQRTNLLSEQTSTNNQIREIKNIHIPPLTREISKYEKNINNLKLEKTRLVAEQASCEGRVTKYKEDIQTLKDSPADTSQKDKWTEQVASEQTALKKIQSDKTKLDDLDSKDRKWKGRINQFYVYLTNKTLSLIQSHCNYYLEAIDSNLRLAFEGFKTLADGRIKESVNAVISRNGQEEEDYKCFSGGEQGRMVFSTILTFQELINEKSKSGGLGLLIIDEVLDQIDSMGLGLFIESLIPLNKTVFIVSQVKTEAPVENTLLIVKEDGTSRIYQE